MILKQVFKTWAGAQKRAAFENAHTKKHRFFVVACDGSGEPLPNRLGYLGIRTYRIEKKSKPAN